MGTDIHAVFQARTPTGWKDVPSKYREERHYQLFAVLADVRNGRGFAGIPTGEVVTPIAEPRGLPDDFEMSADCHPVATLELLGRRAEWHEPNEPLEVWMGDHSYSWLTADEILAWSPPRVLKTGIIDRKDYETWDHKTPPSSYCGGISGPNVVVVRDNKRELETNPKWTHVRVEWEADLREELSYFIEEIARLRAEHGDVRMVFGFDS